MHKRVKRRVEPSVESFPIDEGGTADADDKEDDSGAESEPSVEC